MIKKNKKIEVEDLQGEGVIQLGEVLALHLVQGEPDLARAVFFFKQKTAYEVSVSDWSSDVCSSDLAPVAIRGSAPEGPGYWFPPTVLCPVSNDDRAAREEIFGPVAAVIPFDGEEEGIRLANDTIYGLSGSIWTRNGARAMRMARAVQSGALSVNSNTSVRVSTPFGGFK